MTARVDLPCIRKIVTITQETHVDLGRPVDVVSRRVGVAAVLRNPWYGMGYVEDLRPLQAAVAPIVVDAITVRLREALGGAESVEAFGKAALVGLDGELEHGAALIHTPYFGDRYREAVEGTALIAFSDHRAGPGVPMVVPIWHKTAHSTRAFYQTMEVWIPDAPRENEIVLIGAASAGPRPNARIGDRSTDRVLTRAQDAA